MPYARWRGCPRAPRHAHLVARARHTEAQVVGRDDNVAELREQREQRRRAVGVRHQTVGARCDGA